MTKALLHKLAEGTVRVEMEQPDGFPSKHYRVAKGYVPLLNELATRNTAINDRVGAAPSLIGLLGGGAAGAFGGYQLSKALGAGDGLDGSIVGGLVGGLGGAVGLETLMRSRAKDQIPASPELRAFETDPANKHLVRSVVGGFNDFPATRVTVHKD